MSTKTGIQWTDATWNPIRGCSRVSEGCRNCYAEVIAGRFSGPGQPYEGVARLTARGEARWTGKIVFVEKHLEDPLHWKKPRRVFVNSMSDLFHEDVTYDQLDRIFAVMALADKHTFQVLTKRPERMAMYFADKHRWAMLEGATQALYHKQTGEDPSFWLAINGPLPNVWLGVSVEHQQAANYRIPLLLETPASVRFLSCEPLIGPVDLTPFLYDEVEGTAMPDWSSPRPCNRGLSWVIVGGESGPHARPCNVLWVRDITTQCQSAGVAPFVKQLGRHPVERTDGVLTWPELPLRDSHGGDPEEWPEDLRIREFPMERALV